MWCVLWVRSGGSQQGSATPELPPPQRPVNSGFCLGPAGLHNIYEAEEGRDATSYTPDDYGFYESVIDRLKAEVEREFGLTTLFFTAPTFITRLVGNTSWEPQTMHDQYW